MSVKNIVRGALHALATELDSRRLARAGGPRGPIAPSRAFNLFDIEAAARQRMDRVAWANFAGGNADEITLRWNREAFDRTALRPRFLGDLSSLTTTIELFGHRMPSPILLAPAGMQRAVHPGGELDTAKGAGRRGTTMIVSSMSTTPIEAIAETASAPLWFQLYLIRDRAFSREHIHRASEAGCKVLCVTVDTPSLGPRNRIDRSIAARPWGSTMLQEWLTRTRFALPTPHYRAMDQGHLSGRAVTWADIEWLRAETRLPIVLKGILDPKDAAEAGARGIDGLIVSNHGARNLDTCIASLDALSAIAEAVGDRCTLLLDGGVRRGTDIVKALALGARAVLIGRPYIWGLHLAGAAGVERVIEILEGELLMAMALTGQTDPARVDRSILVAATA
jgi:4-hydroxymandelate oxidase